MTLSRVSAIAALLVLVLAASASAVQVAYDESYLVGDLAGDNGLACHALVDLTDGIYTYTYTLIYTAGVGGIHVFDVENPNGTWYFDATGTGFTAPADGNSLWLEWLGGEMNVGETRTFSYKSYAAPMEIEVWTYVIDGGTSAVGTTLGMGAYIPEPSSLIAFAFGAAGLVPIVIRRRK